MAQQQISQPTGSSVDTDPGIGVVRVKSDWDDEWEVLPYVEPISSVDLAGGGLGSAKLLWRYGKIKRNDKSTYENYLPKTLEGMFVRIDVVKKSGTAPQWYGVIDDDQLDIHGSRGGEYPQGDQEISAFGLEHLLDRYTVTRAKAEQGASVIEIERIPTFNTKNKRGDSLLGNRSLAADTESGDDVYVFGSDSVWTNLDILMSLLTWNLPEDAPLFDLGGQVELLDLIEQVHDIPFGSTLKQVLDRLIDRRRGLGWSIRVDNNDKVVIWIYSILDTPVSVGGVVIEANLEQFNFNVDGYRTARQVIQVLHTSSKYEKVLVVGDYMKSIFTVSVADGTLEPRFNGNLLTEYKDGAKDASGYSGQSSANKARWNDEVRGEDKFDQLGQFRIPATWDRKSSNGQGGTKAVAMPQISEDGELSLTTAVSLWTRDKALLQSLPGMEAGSDYSSDPPIDQDVSDEEPEFRKPFAIVLDPGTNRYIYLDKIPDRAEQAAPSAHMRMIDREMALQIDIKPRHLLLRDHWDGAEITYQGSEEFKANLAFDYEDILATVAMESDQRVKISAYSENVNNGRVLTIEVPDADLVYLAPRTVVGIGTDGALKTSGSTGRLLIDDRERLRAIAACASAWYSRNRSSLVVEDRMLVPFAKVGELFYALRTASDEREVGTVVTRVEIDWVHRVCKIGTQFGSPEFGGSFGPEMATRRAVAQEIHSLRKGQLELNRRTSSLPGRIPAPSAGWGGSGVGLAAKACATTNHGLTGTAAVDGVTISSGDLVLCPFQSTASQNGIYTVTSSGSWTKWKSFDADTMDQPIFVAQGGVFGQSVWFVTGTDAATWNRKGLRARVATTANHGLSGTASVDGVGLSANDFVLVWMQSTSSQNGVYLAQGGAWTKVVSFSAADAGLGIAVSAGTSYGRLGFVVTGANTVVSLGAVFLDA